MSDFSIDTPSPDRGHEAIRVAVLQAIGDLQQNAADTADSFYLADVLFELVDGLLAQVDAVNIRGDADEIRDRTAQDGIDALQQAVADLTARVAALEAASPPPEA